MANWLYRLELRDLRSQYDLDGDMKALCAGHATRIKTLLEKLRKSYRMVLREDMADELENDILPRFEEIAEHGGTEDDFDCVLESLYDWGDTLLGGNPFFGEKVCWINTL